jgi:hypothetical protein
MSSKESFTVPKGSKYKAPNYFLNYAGRRKPYSQVWLEHSHADTVVAQFQAPGSPKLRKIVVLGAATGEILKFFHQKLGLKAWGCELDPWAHGQIPDAYRRRIRLQDLMEYVREQVAKGQSCDLCFSNSLIYLDESQLRKTLPRLARFCRYLHFNSSFLGRTCPDPLRVTTQSYKWWNALITESGFRELRGPKGHRSYLWESTSKVFRSARAS